MLRQKLAECEELMIKGTEKALLMATMEESMEHLARQLRTEQDARRVAELAIEDERKLRRQIEDKVDIEVRLRQEIENRVRDANEVAKQAETLAWKARRAQELDEIEQTNKKLRANDPERNARLEVELAQTKRLLNEERARARAERAVAETTQKAEEDRPRLDEDSEKTRFERRVKEEVLLAMAKHEREMTIALSKAAEDKVNALEQAAVQKRQTISQLEEFHKSELRRVEERAEKAIEAARTEMRPQRAEFEALVQQRLDDHKTFVDERKQALALARDEYEANLDRIRQSHEAEVKGLREAAENLMATLKWEAEGEEGTRARTIEDIGRQLRDTKEILDREARLREQAEARSEADLAARRTPRRTPERLSFERGTPRTERTRRSATSRLPNDAPSSSTWRSSACEEPGRSDARFTSWNRARCPGPTPRTSPWTRSKLTSASSSTTSGRRRSRTRGSRCTTPRRPIARRWPTCRSTSPA